MSNDNFANATVLAGTTFVGNNIGYTTEVDEPDAENDGGWATAWHIWITPDNFVGDAIIDTIGSSFDTYLWIYTGTAIDDLTEIDSDDDGGPGNSSKIIYNPVAGTVYYIRVGGYDEGDEGEYVLRYPYTTGSGAAPAPHTIDGTLFDSTYVQGQEGDVQVNVALTSGATFDSTVTGAGPGSDVVDNENFEIFGVSAEGFTAIGDVPDSLNREPLTSDTAGAPGGTGEILLTIDQSETMETAYISEPYSSPSADLEYREPDQFGPGVELFDSTYTLGGFTTGVDLRKTANSSVTADSYSIGATTLTNIQVPNEVDNIFIVPTTRGILAYWYPQEDISGAPTLDYEIYLSDGTTHRAGRYGSFDNHYYGTLIQCQSSLPVRARIVARNVNGFSQPSDWSEDEVTPFNSDETGFGMQGIELRDKFEGIWNADGTLKDGTGSSGVVTNIHGSRTDTDEYTLVWDEPEYTAVGPTEDYYITVLENGAFFEEGSYGSDTYQSFDGLTEGKEYTFFVWHFHDDGIFSPTPAPFIVTFEDTVPLAPVITDVTAGDGYVDLAWDEQFDGGTSLTGTIIYVYVDGLLVDSNLTGTGGAGTAFGLTNGTEYTFRISAVNALGEGALSEPSDPVTPTAP